MSLSFLINLRYYLGQYKEKTMAFFGILILMYAFMMIMFLIVCIVLFVFIPALIIAIANLVLGIKHQWPKHNIILLSIFGSIVALLILIGISVAFIPAIHNLSYTGGSESIEASKLLLSTLI